MPDATPTPSTPPKAAATKAAAPKRAVHVDPQQILTVVEDAESLIGWKHLSNKTRAAIAGGFVSAVVSLVLALVS